MKLEILLKDKEYQSLRSLPLWLQRSQDITTQILSLRKTLGMTQAQLAKRSDQNPRLIRRLESGDDIDVQLSTLKKTAWGLECELLVQFVPKQPLSKLLKNKAAEKAKKIIRLSKGTAAMEDQEPKNKYVQQQIVELADELIAKKLSLLWED